MAYQLKKSMTYDYFLDTIGESCPIPVTKTQAKMTEIPVGSVLCVASDDGAIIIDLPAWCHSNRQEFLGYRKDGNIIYCYLKKINKMLLELS
jgi:TusA-related sulfurtransferase